MKCELQLTSVPIDGAIGPRAVDDDGGVRTCPGLEAQKRTVAGGLVFEHELEHDVPVEMDRDPCERFQHRQRDCDARFVVHGATPNEHAPCWVNLCGEWWM